MHYIQKIPYYTNIDYSGSREYFKKPKNYPYANNDTTNNNYIFYWSNIHNYDKITWIIIFLFCHVLF